METGALDGGEGQSGDRYRTTALSLDRIRGTTSDPNHSAYLVKRTLKGIGLTESDTLGHADNSSPGSTTTL